jgi:hypothetical protein
MMKLTDTAASDRELADELGGFAGESSSAKLISQRRPEELDPAAHQLGMLPTLGTLTRRRELGHVPRIAGNLARRPRRKHSLIRPHGASDAHMEICCTTST